MAKNFQYGEGYGPKPWLDAGIDATLRAIVRDRYNPTQMGPSPSVKVVGAATASDPLEPEKPVNRSGWVDSRPLAPPVRPGSYEEHVINSLIDQACGPVFPRKAEAKPAEVKFKATPKSEVGEIKRRRVE